jgi:hypothetical protein
MKREAGVCADRYASAYHLDDDHDASIVRPFLSSVFHSRSAARRSPGIAKRTAAQVRTAGRGRERSLSERQSAGGDG